MGMCIILRKKVQYFGYRIVWGYPSMELCVVGLQMPRTSRSRRNSPVRHVARDRPTLPTVDDTKQAQPSLLFTASMQPRRFFPSLTKRRRRTRDKDSKPGRKKKKKKRLGPSKRKWGTWHCAATCGAPIFPALQAGSGISSASGHTDKAGIRFAERLS